MRAGDRLAICFGPYVSCFRFLVSPHDRIGVFSVSRAQAGVDPFLSENVTFRVWAPHATAVNVASEFNFWSTTATSLAPEANGFWSNEVHGAMVGQLYIHE
jgi:1,4-alpha-glucan branching enzyme